MTAVLDHVSEYGVARNRPSVVLGHAITTDRSTLAPTARHLSHDHHVVTWDSRGHGTRGIPAGAYTHSDLAHDLAEVLDGFGLDRAVVGGVSQGAFVALELALLHPDRVAGLVLVACRADAIPRDVIPPQRDAIDRWVTDGLDSGHARWMAEMNFGEDGADNDAWVERWVHSDGRHYADAFEALFAKPDLTGRLREVAAPALVIRGEHDAWVPAPAAEALAAGLSGSGPVVTIAGAAHVTTATHPEATAAAITRFLAGLSTR